MGFQLEAGTAQARGDARPGAFDSSYYSHVPFTPADIPGCASTEPYQTTCARMRVADSEEADSETSKEATWRHKTAAAQKEFSPRSFSLHYSNLDYNSDSSGPIVGPCRKKPKPRPHSGFARHPPQDAEDEDWVVVDPQVAFRALR